MKTKFLGIELLLFALAACIHLDDRSVETRFIASPENKALQELSAIDSLMWHQPDSALMRLIPYFDACCRDALNASPNNTASPDNATDTTRRNHCVSTTAYNHHYAHLLLSELLYKNNYAQTNRKELQQAVAYFDSLVRQAPPLQRRLGRFKNHLPTQMTSSFSLMPAPITSMVWAITNRTGYSIG